MSVDLTRAEAFSAVSWILKNKIVNENGSPIEFEDHAFLIDPYTDNTPEQVIEKCSQIGWSVLSILRSFHLCRFAGANIIHTFPSRNIAKDFVVPKVDPLIFKNPSIQKMVGVSSRYLKQIGDRFIYYRGTYEQTEAISISAHILINDEYDRSKPKVLRTYRSRLDDAKRERPELGWEWKFSNPSIPGKGVDEFWGESDQKHWFVKCGRCGYDWYLKFPENINFRKKIKVCAECHEELTRADIINGRWVRKFLNRESSGYWISQMMVPWITAAKIIKDSKGDQEVFHNFTLGRPFVSKDSGVTRETIIRCIAPGYNRKNNVAMGVDNGIYKHYVLGNRDGIFEYGKTKDWKKIENLRNQYNAYMVMDANPYPNIPTKLAAKYPGKAYIHYYQQDKKQAGVIRWNYDEGVVVSDRTKVIDAVVAELNSRDITFNMTSKDLESYIYHWEQMYRIVTESAQGIMKPTWKKIENRPDDYGHATIYWRVALEQTIGVGGIVGTITETEETHPIASPDQTVPALDLEKFAERAGKKEQKTWKSV